jgi:thiol-disulfide isomerase/thioredoxin
MKKIFFALLSFSFLFLVSCSQKENVKETPNNTVKPQTTAPEKNNVNTSNESTSGKSSYFSVKNSESAGKNNEWIDFTWQENGKDVKLSDSKGKVILLNFWATWCPPCKKELPDLSQIAKDYSGKNFKMIGISVDENPQALKDFLNSNSLSYTILHETNGLLEKYMSVTGGTDNVIPQSFIIDKNGKIVEAIIGGKSKTEFISLINKYL